MDEPNGVLLGEHREIEALAGAISGLNASVRGEGALPVEDVRRALDLARDFGDRFHHTKEEKVLFPALRDASPVTGRSLIQELEREHVGLRSMLQDARRALTLAERNPGDRSGLGLLLEQYGLRLRRLLGREMRALFPEVQRSIPEAERRQLLVEFAWAESEEMGDEVQDRKRKAIDELAEAYSR